MAVLFVAEIENNQLSLASEACLRKIVLFHETATEEEKGIDLLVLDERWKPLCFPKDLLEKCRTLLCARTQQGDNLFPEEVAPFIASIAFNYTLVTAAHTHKFSAIMLRVAASLNQNPILDVSEIVRHNSFECVGYNGLFIKSIETKASMQILTLRAVNTQKTVKPEMVELGEHSFSSVQDLGVTDLSALVSGTASRKVTEDNEGLLKAKIVIGCGGGVETKEQFGMIVRLTQLLKAEIAGSKVFIDAGFLSSHNLIGQSGKEISPNIYLALGISGSMHHLSAVRDAKVIITVNKDAEASILALSDYSLIGDIDVIIPELIMMLE